MYSSDRSGAQAYRTRETRGEPPCRVPRAAVPRLRTSATRALRVSASMEQIRRRWRREGTAGAALPRTNRGPAFPVRIIRHGQRQRCTPPVALAGGSGVPHFARRHLPRLTNREVAPTAEVFANPTRRHVHDRSPPSYLPVPRLTSVVPFLPL